MSVSATEKRVLRAMAKVQAECSSRKSVVVLRYALLEAGCWDDGIEHALCNEGLENPIVADHYNSLRRLILETNLADGAGDFRTPAGPRYTECWVTQRGIEYLEHLATTNE